MLSEALAYLGIATGPHHYDRQSCSAMTRQAQRELAAKMRVLPGRFADRLPARALERIIGAAAAGRWEEAVDDLITVLHTRGAAITVCEREELRTVLEAMNMAGGHLDTVPVKR